MKNHLLTTMLLCSSLAWSCASTHLKEVLPDISEVSDAVFLVHTELGGGTAWQGEYKGNKYIISNSHVCEAALFNYEGYYTMTLSQRGRDDVSARVLYQDSVADVCILDASGVSSPLSLSISKDVSLWDGIKIVGHPHLGPLTPSEGLILDRTHTVIANDNSKDTCVGDHQEWRMVPTFLGLEEMCLQSVDSYKSNAVTYPGNSGSPAVGSDGRVKGMLFAGDTLTNYGSLVPADVIITVLEEFLQSRH